MVLGLVGVTGHFRLRRTASAKLQNIFASVLQDASELCGSESFFASYGPEEQTQGKAELRQGALELQCTGATAYDRTRRSSSLCSQRSACSHSLKALKNHRGTMRRRWLGLSCAALVAERAAPLNPLRRLLRRPPPVSDAR